MVRRLHDGKDHREVAAALWRLGKVRSSQGRVSDSVSLYEESLSMSRRFHDHQDHDDVAALLLGLAGLYRAQGRTDEAAALEQESLAMQQRLVGSTKRKREPERSASPK